MTIERKWAMANKWTFTIKPITDLLNEEVDDGLWIDPFSGENSPAQFRNDLNSDIEADSHMDAIAFLESLPNNFCDGVLLDPPYSTRQISEHYKAAGLTVTGWHTSAGWQKKIKDEAARVVKPGGKIICFGWNSMGMGLSRNFEMTRVLLVPHGGAKNDTIITVEVAA
jgi:hypothetical protein